MTKKVYGMVTTNASWMYTIHALSSFAVTTPMEDGDQFILIDNDGAASASMMFSDTPISNFTVHKNETSKSFAENANFILDIAMKNDADFVFLNNDIIFTPGWFESLASVNDNIVVPCCNQHVQYNTDDFKIKPSMELEEFLGKENHLHAIVQYHKEQALKKSEQPTQYYSQYLTIPFYCVKIPQAVYSKVGYFDTQFGKGGAEDTDYCLRAQLLDFNVLLGLNSYLLHFQGKSTWRGPETPFDTATRNSDYTVAFADKWGYNLAQLLLKNNSTCITSDQEILGLFENKQLKELILALLQKDNFNVPELKL